MTAYAELKDGTLARRATSAEEDICRCGSHGRTFYGHWVDHDGVEGFTGWRGPYCGRTCYFEDWPEEDRY